MDRLRLHAVIRLEANAVARFGTMSENASIGYQRIHQSLSKIDGLSPVIGSWPDGE